MTELRPEHWLAIVQICSTAALALLAVSVSAASFVIAYRNNFGWKPLVVVVGYSLRFEQERDYPGAMLVFEIWNRRKYPIVIRRIGLDAPAFTEEGFHWSEVGWHVIDDGPLLPDSLAIAGSSHKRYAYEHLLHEIGQMSGAKVRLTVEYFDPRSNNSKTITLDYRFPPPGPPLTIATPAEA